MGRSNHWDEIMYPLPEKSVVPFGPKYKNEERGMGTRITKTLIC